MVSKEKRFEARKAWAEYGAAIVKAFEFPSGSMIVVEPVESMLEDSNEKAVEAFIKWTRQQTEEVRTMKFLGEA